MAFMWQFVWVWISELAQTRLLEKKEEKTKFWGWLVESVVKKKTVIESTFDYWILRLNMNIASFILWMDYWINKQNHFSFNEFNSLFAKRILDLLFYLFLKFFCHTKLPPVQFVLGLFLCDWDLAKKNSCILHTMMAWLGWSNTVNSWKDCAQLYLLTCSTVLTI